MTKRLRLGLVAGVAVVDVTAACTVAIFGAASGAPTGEVVESVAVVVFLIATVAVLPWTLVTAGRARRIFGRPASLDASRSDSKQVWASVRNSEINADPYIQELAEREARRTVWVAPAVVSSYALLVPLYVVLFLVSPTLVRWAWALTTPGACTGVALQAVWWRRSKRYLASSRATPGPGPLGHRP